MENLKDIPPLGIYIHVPFCVSKCPYCDFYSIGCAGRNDTREYMDRYTDSVKRELKTFFEKSRTNRVDTVYFGGGTPILLTDRRINAITDEIYRLFSVDKDAEVTMEANPYTALSQQLSGYRSAGINRLSFGLQSANDDELKLLGRLHSAHEADQCVKAAQKAGFENISLDLMTALPYQTEEKLLNSVKFCSELNVQHISAYILKVEEGTPFYVNDVQAICPDEDRQAQLYLYTVQALKEHGYEQYEISNFSSEKKYRARHNVKYWNCDEYIGIGPSAHSFFNGRRMYYPRDLKLFIDGTSPTDDGEGGGWEEYLMLRLRLSDGLDFDALRQRGAEQSDIDRIIKKAQPMQKAGFLKLENDNIRLTPEGFLISNSIIAELLF